MGVQLLQITYHLNVNLETFRRTFGPAAHDIARVPGLRWKVWVYRPDAGEGGGIYLFEDEASLHAYLDGPIVAAIKSHPAFGGVSVDTFDVLTDETAATRGPIEEAAAGGRFERKEPS